jgi:hypothetical protein
MRVARANIDVVGNVPIITGAKTVFVNNQPLAIKTVSTTSTGAIIVGASATVFAENLGVARKADSTNRGQGIATGSSDVFVNQPND